jgi:hypothetical protein
MGPEFWVGLAAVFVSGGAIGAAGTLLAQWLIRKVGASEVAVRPPNEREVSLLRQDVSDLVRQVHNLDARLDFQEQLLGGATPMTQPPPRLAPPEDPGAT